MSKSNDYKQGFIAGLREYAWWKNGVQYVGTCGTTLWEAIQRVEQETDKPLWSQVKDLEEEQGLHDIIMDASTERAELAEAKVKRLEEELWDCVRWLESRPDFTEGDMVTASSARGLLETGRGLKEEINANNRTGD